MGKKLLEFLQSVSGEEEARLLRKLKRATYASWPTTRAEQEAGGFVLPQAERPYSAEEKRILGAHAAAVTSRDAAREAWENAIGALEKARRPWPSNQFHHEPLTTAQEAEIAQCQDVAGALRQALDAASAAEVAARPNNAGRPRRQAFSIR